MAGGKTVPALQMLGDFADNTSAHGVRKLHEKSHWFFKVIWLLLLLAATGNIIMQVWQLIILYERRPVTTKTTIHSRSLTFPTVTVCNLNPFQYSKIQKEEYPMETLRHISKTLNISLEQFGGTQDTGQNYEEPVDTEASNTTQSEDYTDENSGEFSVSQFLSEGLDQFRMETLLTLTETSDVQRLAQPISELLVSCSFAGSPCRHNDFSWVFDHDYMNCFQFPPDNRTRSSDVYSAGQLFGLSLILNVDQKEYVPFVTPSAGVRVAVHENGSPPNLMQKGLTAPPGFETSVGIRPTVRIHQPDPYGNCESDSPYGDIQTCERSCLEDLIEMECDCSRRIDNPNNLTYVCSGGQSDCIKTVVKNMQKGNLTCSACRISCREHGYIQRVSMATWPSDHYDMALRTVINKEKNLGDIDTRKNLVSLNIFFSELIEEVVQEEPAYMWENLQSDIGGQLGLWLGISVLSLCEVVELFLKMLGTCCKSKTDNKIVHVAAVNEK